MIIDGHEDLAFNIMTIGRDITQSVAAIRTREDQPHPGVGTCTVALPELLIGDVGLVFGTLFTIPASAAPSALPSDHGYHTADEAHTVALAQLQIYRDLAANRDDVRLIAMRADLRTLLADRAEGAAVLGVVPLMENADPIRVPEEAAWWQAQGVRIVGPAWQATRYCGGTRQPGPLTDVGRTLMGELARAGLTLDVSHMAEESFWQALDLFDGAVIASHSNCRALASATYADRHLSDAMIRALIERDAVIGVVLFNRFLIADYTSETTKDAVTLDAAIRHIDHICQIAGDARHVAIGSDFDGGFGREHIPRELDSVADLHRLGDSLRAAGYSQSDADAIMGGNWLRTLERTLPV